MKSVSFTDILPEQASTIAREIDDIYLFILFVSVVVTVVVGYMALKFAIKYRRVDESLPEPPHEHPMIEIVGSLFLTVVVMVMFVWGAVVFFKAWQPPADAMEILVVGKQWMWKLQHPEGKREINTLHVPVGQKIKLTMTSEDVIHSFYIPAFRVKSDVVPGRYTTIWFEATKTGDYNLFCTEYCGTEHSRMGGFVHVLAQADYERWLKGQAPGSVAETPVVAGAKLFTQFGCATCHNAESGARGPNLAGLVGTKVLLSDGSEVTADDDYLRESIVNSQAKIVDGYDPLMPIFKGLISEDQLMQILAYIKSLAGKEGPGS